MARVPLHEVKFCCNKFADAAYAYSRGMKAEGDRLMKAAGERGCRPLRAFEKDGPLTIAGLRSRKSKRVRRRR